MTAVTAPSFISIGMFRGRSGPQAYQFSRVRCDRIFRITWTRVAIVVAPDITQETMQLTRVRSPTLSRAMLPARFPNFTTVSREARRVTVCDRVAHSRTRNFEDLPGEFARYACQNLT
jgi:hypothetical protein